MNESDRIDIQTLISYATGELFHEGAGLCPGYAEGFDSRDPECVVCKAIDAVQKLIGGAL